MTVTDKEIDRVMAAIGGYRRYQMITYFVISFFASGAYAFSSIIIVFIGAQTPHHCKIPANSTLNGSIPWDNKIGRFSQCLVNDDNGSEVTCSSGWEYQGESQTIISEFDLVCDRAYLPDLAQSVFTAGSICGSIVLSLLADRFGRKPVLIMLVFVLSILSTATSFVQSAAAFTALRFFTGFFSKGTVGFSYSMELFSSKYRTFAGVASAYVWCFLMFLVVFVAYFLRNWRHLQLAFAAPGFLVLVLYWLAQESIPWLIANGRLKEAKEAIAKIAKFNKIPIPTIYEEEEMMPMNEGCAKDANWNNKLTSRGANCQDNETKSEDMASQHVSVPQLLRKMCCSRSKRNTVSENMSAILHSRRMLIITSATCFVWFVNSLVYWGLILSVQTLFPGDLFLNFTLTTVAETIGYMAVHVIIRYGRRKPLIAFHVIAGISLICATFSPGKAADGTDLTPLVTTFGLICKFGICGSFATIYVCTVEVFPTNLRSSGIGIASVFADIGSVIAPFTGTVARALPWLPGVLFGTFALLAGLACVVLPETLNRPLPETVQDVENWTKLDDNDMKTCSPSEKC